MGGAPVQSGPESHTGSYNMGTGSLFSGVMRPERGVNHPPPPSAEVKERVNLYLYSLSGPSWPVLGLTLPFKELIIVDHESNMKHVHTALQWYITDVALKKVK